MPIHIPDNAKLVFRWVRFSIFQWSQKLFDWSETTFEIAVRLDSVRAIAVTSDGFVLVNVEEQPGCEIIKTLPGGVVEEWESPEYSIKREILEETGYSTDSLELYTIENPGYQLQCDRFIYIARNCKKNSIQKCDAGEKIEVLILKLDDFFEQILSWEIWSWSLQKDFLIEYRKDPSMASVRKRLGVC